MYWDTNGKFENTPEGLNFKVDLDFIAEEHWNCFDDYYSPDYTVSRIWDKFIPYIRSGALAGECLEELEAGLAEIESSEAYQEYHIPSMIPFHDFKNAETFLVRFGSHR